MYSSKIAPKLGCLTVPGGRCIQHQHLLLHGGVVWLVKVKLEKEVSNRVYINRRIHKCMYIRNRK